MCISFGGPLWTCSSLCPHYLLYRTRQENSNCREEYSGPDGLLCSMRYRGLFDLSSAYSVNWSCRKPPEKSNCTKPLNSIMLDSF